MKAVYVFLVLVIALSGCAKTPAPAEPPAAPVAQVSTDTPPPTATDTPQPSATRLPTHTPTHTPTPTSTATFTPSPTHSPTLSTTPAHSPTSERNGKPLPAFKTVPIMPGAVSGQVKSSIEYEFIIAATLAEVKSFYASAFAKQGKTCLEFVSTPSPTWTNLVCMSAGPLVTVVISTLEDGRQQVTIIAN